MKAATLILFTCITPALAAAQNRPATAQELSQMQLGERAFSAPVAAARFINNSAVIVISATIEVQIISGDAIVGARQFRVSNFDDWNLGRQGSLLPHNWGNFTIANTFSQSESQGTNGYWLQIVDATVHVPSTSANASFLDVAADLINHQHQFIAFRLQRDPSIAKKTDEYGMSLMHVAAYASDTDVMLKLRAAGGSYTCRTRSGVQPIHTAAGCGAYPSIGFLRAQSVDLDAKGEYGWRPLHYAVRSWQVNSIKFLLPMASINAVDDRHETPLELAAEWDGETVAELLLEWHADPNVRSASGDLPILKFAERGSPKIIEDLVRAGAAVDATYSDNPLTALHNAAKYGNQDVAVVLLSLGANPNARTNNGNTPADLARKYGHDDLAEFLKSREGAPRLTRANPHE